jgi:hypothetical protein
MRHVGIEHRTPGPIPAPSIQLDGPGLGRLYLMGDGSRIRVTGRAWDLFDHADLIEVSIERKNGYSSREELSIALFDALTSDAKVVL